MRNTLIICRKELKGYFASPIAYLLMAFFALIFGFFFYSATRFLVDQAFRAQMMGGGMPPPDLNEYIIRPLLMNASVVALFILPMLCMRLFAEEKRSGTIELLLTSPVRDIEIILGKWLAAMAMYAGIIGFSAINIIMLFAYGQPDWRPILVGYLGLLLQGGCLLAIGTFISTTTSNQIIAAGATFGTCLLLWVLDWVSSYSTTIPGKIIAYCSVVQHFEPFSKGIIDSKDVIFFASVIFFGLFLTARSLESLKWRA